MSKIKLILLSLALLLGSNSQSTELTQYVTPKNVAATLATAGAIYGAYKVYQSVQAKKLAKLEEFKVGQAINDKLLITEQFKISQDTIIAFDLHDVIAKYDTFKMFKKALSSPIALIALRYPGIFPLIGQQVKAGSSVQQMFEAIEDEYPGNENIKKLAALAIDISAQLKPIQGTIDIAKQLMDNGYQVIFISNIEPKLWDRFVIDFPEFKNCKKWLPTSETNWVKKPSQEYFKACKDVIIQELEYDSDQEEGSDKYNNAFKKLNLLFIDDRVKNVVPALEQGIPSYVFTTPTRLKFDLIEMGANLD